MKSLTKQYIFMQKLKGEPIHWQLMSNVRTDSINIEHEQLLYETGVWEDDEFPETHRAALRINYPLYAYYKSPGNEFSYVERVMIDGVSHSIRKLQAGQLINNEEANKKRYI